MFSYKLFAHVSMKAASLITAFAMVLSVLPVGVFSTAYAATVLPLESFGTTTVNDIPNWDEEGSDSDSSTLAQAAGSGNDSASPNGGAFAKIAQNEWMCREINASSREGLQLSYYWRGDSDAGSSSDDGIVEYKAGSGSCSDGSGWSQLQNHDMRDDSSWNTQNSFNLPNALDNTTFRLRFRTQTNSSDELFRVDGITIIDSSNYVVTVDQPVTISGLTVTLTGTGEGTPYVGQLSQHDVQVDWGNGTVDNTSTVNFVDPAGAPKNFTGTWTNAFTYAASGVYTIIVKLYHQTVPGAESSGDATFSFNVTIPEPDLDADDDGILDVNDNCPVNANPGQENNDGDTQGDVCDNDDDNDTVVDTSDNCPITANTNQANNDGDAEGDVCDNDDDNDSVTDGSDNCPINANTNQANNDGDAEGDVCDNDDDNDTVEDGNDNCPITANAGQEDNDNDGIGDVCDNDDDNDGVTDGSDNCPINANPAQENTDADAQGDICDNDDDNDTVEDGSDNCPVIANLDQANADGDASGDVCDEDLDGDTVQNDDDNCPAVPNTNQTNTDGDSEGDACDNDDDNDLVNDDSDNCPVNANMGQENNDEDTQGDICDNDDDNDGVNDTPDNCPINANADQADNDEDGLGDVCDNDDDNDTIEDDGDNCPLVGNVEQYDRDEDLIGDECDDDVDGDDVGNDDDNCPIVYNPLQVDDDNDDIGNLCDSDIDGDEVVNLGDNCPFTYNPSQTDSDNDNIGDACENDTDGDDVDNNDDNCPVTPNAEQSDIDEDNVGDACDDDMDGDEIVNDDDNCPVNANPDQADNDNDGVGNVCDSSPDGETSGGGGGGGSGSGGGTDPVDMCPNLAGTQEMVPVNHTFSNGQCIPPQSSGGGSTEAPAAPAATETPAGEVLGESCEPLITTFMREGKKNDVEEVKKLQSFLNKEMGSTLEVDGVFGPSTTSIVNDFQLKYSSEVLAPWTKFGLKSDKTPTGYVFKTTQRWINKLNCAELEIPMPQLP